MVSDDDLCDCMSSGIETSAHEANCYVEMSAVRQHCALCARDNILDPGFCEHLTEYVQKGWDARELDFGVEFDVPLVVKWNMWAKVRISTDSIADMCAPISLMVDDIFTNTVEEHSLGLWNKGEGMWSIRYVLFDWLRARAGIQQLSETAACKSSAHNPFKHDKIIASLANNGPKHMMHNWVVACYGMCIVEYEQVSGANLVPRA